MRAVGANLTPCLYTFAAGNFAISFFTDNTGAVFTVLFALVFLLCGIYALGYFEASQDIRKFEVFYLLSLSALIGIGLSNSLATLYVFFVLAALLSSPLVSFDNTQQAKKTAKEYVKHSLTGAVLALIGLCAVIPNLQSPYFAYGGMLKEELNMPNWLF